MRPLRGLTVLCATVASTVVMTPGVAGAHTTACAGTVQITTTDAMHFVGFGGPVVTEFRMSFIGASICFGGQFESFEGTLSGHCGLAFGTGDATTSTAHPFALTWSGNSVVLRGNTAGELKIVTGAPGCTSGATQWTATGQVVLHHLGIG